MSRGVGFQLVALVLVCVMAGCAAPHRRPDGTLTDKPHGDARGRIPRGGTNMADGTLPPGGDRCTAALIGRNGNPNVTGVMVGNVAYIAAGQLPGTVPGMGSFDQDKSSEFSSTAGAKKGNGPPNARAIMISVVRENCPHLAEIRMANDGPTASLIASLAGEVAAGRPLAARLREIADLDRNTHIVGAGVTGSGSGGARGGQPGTGMPSAGGTGP